MAVCVCVCVCVPARSVVSDSLRPPWTVTRQVCLSMKFSRQEYWSGVPFPLQRTFSTQRLNSPLLRISCLGRQILYH